MAALNLGYVIVISISLWCGWTAFTSRSCKSSSLCFFIAILVSMFLLRVHQLTWNHEYNPDESQMMAQGMRFLAHPVPWRDVDGETGGPLDSQILSVPLLFGAPASWLTGRFTMLVLNFLTLIFLYRTMRCFCSAEDSRVAILPAVIFYAFIFDKELVHYSSETLPVALLAAGSSLLAGQWKASRPTLGRWFVLGAICGALPFAKMQAAPLGLFYALLGCILIFVRRSGVNIGWRNKLGQFFALGCGGISVAALFLVPVALCGAFDDFVNCYLRSSVSYVDLEGPSKKWQNVWEVLSYTPDFWRFFLFGTLTPLILLPACCLFRKKNPGATWVVLLFVSFANCLVAFACIVIAGKNFYHYAFLLLPALTIWFGMVFLCCQALFMEKGQVLREMPVTSRLWFAGFVIALALFQWRETHYFHHMTRHRILDFPNGRPMSLVAQRVREMRQPGDTLAIWGWMPAYYLETGMAPATRNVQSRLLIEQPLHQQYYRNRFMADLEKSRPPIFIDAIAGNQFQFTWTNAPNHEVFPRLNEYVRDHYTLWLSIYMTNKVSVGSPIRVYVANDRAKHLHLKHEDIYARADPFYMPPSEHPNRQLASISSMPVEARATTTAAR